MIKFTLLLILNNINHLLIKVALISATLPHEILEMTSKFMTDPIRILVKRDELTLEGKLWIFIIFKFKERYH